MAKIDRSINPDLIVAINTLMEQVLQDKDATPLDKLRVIDRALALEKIKQKMDDSDWGSGFGETEEETDDQRG